MSGSQVTYVKALTGGPQGPPGPPGPPGEQGEQGPPGPGTAGVALFNGREGNVTLASSDVTSASGILNSGGVMTGPFVVSLGHVAPHLHPLANDTQPALDLTIDGPPPPEGAPSRGLNWSTNGMLRWRLCTWDDESGGSLGSNLSLIRYADDGSPRNVVWFDRLSCHALFYANVEVSEDLTVDGALTVIGPTSVPTMAPGDASQAIATTAFVTSALGAVPIGSNMLPLMDGPVAIGSSLAFARADHVHPVDTSRYAAANPAGYVTAAGAASAAPVQSVAARTGAVTLTHTDITDWTTVMTPYALTSSVPVASTTNPTMAGTAAPGTGTTWARADHVHPVDSSRMPVMGVTNGSDAAAGQVGEFLSTQTLSTAAIKLTSNTDAGLVTLALTAGDWDVWGSVGLTLTGNNSNTTAKGWINPAGGATAPSIDQMGGQTAISVANSISTVILPVTPMRVSLAASGSIRLGATVAFSSQASAWGKLMARRAR